MNSYTRILLILIYYNLVNKVFVSTTIALIGVIDKWSQGMDNGLVTAAVFVDLTKAFDTVKHSLLNYRRWESRAQAYSGLFHI